MAVWVSGGADVVAREVNGSNGDSVRVSNRAEDSNEFAGRATDDDEALEVMEADRAMDVEEDAASMVVDENAASMEDDDDEVHDNDDGQRDNLEDMVEM